MVGIHATKLLSKKLKIHLDRRPNNSINITYCQGNTRRRELVRKEYSHTYALSNLELELPETKESQRRSHPTVWIFRRPTIWSLRFRHDTSAAPPPRKRKFHPTSHVVPPRHVAHSPSPTWHVPSKTAPRAGSSSWHGQSPPSDHSPEEIRAVRMLHPESHIKQLLH